LLRLQEEMRMDEDKLQKKIAAKEEELKDLKETLQLFRHKKEIEGQVASQRVEQIQQATIKTKEEAHSKCPICARADGQEIDAAIKEMNASGGSAKPIRERFSLTPSQLILHEQHMEA